MAKTAKTEDPRQTVTPYICVKDAARAIDFFKKAFGAIKNYRLTEPGGRIGHADIAIGDTVIMLADEYPDYGALSPQTIGGSPVTFHLKVADADAAVARAVEAGAVVLRPVEKQFYGELSGMVTDPFGYRWFLSQKVEDVSPEEMQRRWDKAFAV